MLVLGFGTVYHLIYDGRTLSSAIPSAAENVLVWV